MAATSVETLVEREAALERMDALLDDARAGRGRCAIVEGEGGIGKTALLEVAARRASDGGMDVLSARCANLERAFVFGVVRQMLEPTLLARGQDERARLFSGAAALAAPLLLGSDEGAAPQGGDTDFGTLHGVYWLLATLTQERPLLLVVDDAQWSDTPSLRLLDFLVRRLDGLPILLLVALRPDDPSGAHPLLAELRGSAGHGLIEPGPLSEGGARVLVGQHLRGSVDPEFAAACMQATGGNPFYLHAILRDLAREGCVPSTANAGRVDSLAPRGVARTVERRLGTLPAGARALVEAVAILGDGVVLEDAATLADLSLATATAASEALAHVSILEQSSAGALQRGAVPPFDALAFVHPVVRASVYESITPRERAERHARAARLIGARRGAPEDVAAHVILATPGADPAAVSILRAAATAALERGAPDVAAAYLSRTLSEPLDEPDRCEILLELGGAEARAAMPGAAPHLEEALALAGDDALRAAATRVLAAVLMALGRSREAVQLLDRQIAGLEGAAPDLAAELEGQLLGAADIDPSLRPLIRARLRAGRREAGISGNGVSPVALGHRAVQAALEGTSAREAAELAERALASGELLADRLIGGQLHFLMVFVLTVAGRYEVAARHLDAVLEEAGARGRAVPFVLGNAQRAALRSRTGSLIEGEADARAALEVARLNRWPPLAQMALTGLVDVLVERGRPEAAADELEASGFSSEGAPTTVQDAVLLEARGRMLLNLGDTEGGTSCLLKAGRLLLSWDLRSPGPFAWRSAAALGLSRLGDEERALALAQEEVVLARGWGAPRALAVALRAEGLLTGGQEGIALLREAVDVVAPSGAETVRAQALTDLGAALRRSNNRAEARGPLREGLELARTCGAAALTERAHTELWATGARPRTPLRSGLDALTPSERRVAGMAASGMSNPTIAQNLFVTVKTVEMHLSSVYRKLGIGSRAELNPALGLR